MRNVSCPVCGGSSDLTVAQSGVEGGKVKRAAGDVAVLHCGVCDFDFLDIWDNAGRAYEFYAHDEYVYVPDIDDAAAPAKFDEYKMYLEFVRPYLGPDTRVLDIGCGDGRFLKMVRPLAGHVSGTEMTPELVNRLRADGLEIWDQPLDRIQPSAPFDVVCMHAVLEHVPNVDRFLEDLKRFLHKDSQVFITVPNGLDPLTAYYDVEKYRRFFYREYHFYYFTEKSLTSLMTRLGYRASCHSTLMASITNHFHWMHHHDKQRGRGEFTDVRLPVDLRREAAPSGAPFMALLGEVDDFYRRRLAEEGIGDLLHCRASLA